MNVNMMFNLTSSRRPLTRGDVGKADRGVDRLEESKYDVQFDLFSAPLVRGDVGKADRGVDRLAGCKYDVQFTLFFANAVSYNSSPLQSSFPAAVMRTVRILSCRFSSVATFTGR